MAINFDKETHKYTNEDGKELISVTTLLRKHNLSPNYGDVPEAILKRAAERGTLVHEEIDNYIKTGELGITAELGSFIEEIKRRGLKILKNEYLVNNDIIAGQVDLLVEDTNGKKILVDFKTTSAIHKESVTWQTNIYGDLDTEDIDEFEAWHFDSEGKLTVVPLSKMPTSELDRLYACERNGELYTQMLVGLDSDIATLSDLEVKIANFEKSKKEMEAQAKSIREKIMTAMAENNIKRFESTKLIFTIKAGGVRKTVDVNKLLADYPDIDKSKYEKESVVKDSLLITIKGE